MNLAAALTDAGRADPERVALRIPDGDVSYRALHGSAARVQALVAAEAQPGDRVVLVAGNTSAFVAGYLGVLAAGAVAVPVNPAAPAAEVRREIDVVQPALVLAAAGHVDLARRAATGVEVVDLDATAAEPSEPGASVSELAPLPRAADDLAALLFTTGVAGPPKAAMLTHGSLLANLDQLQRHPGTALHPDDVGLVALPCFHVFGLNVALGLPLRAGAACSLVSHFHPAETLDRIRHDRVTVVAGVPAMFEAWLALDEDAAPADAFASVRLAASGAAALPVDTIAAMRRRFGVDVHEGYGLTEASPVVTSTAVGEPLRPGSIGPPLPGVEVRLVDVDGAPVLEGDAGEILVRGPNVFAGYWNDPEATAQAVTPDGWLHTGDVAVADADGWLTLVDRAKDVVIVSGFNVYPGEVEDALRDHPAVADVAVVGEAHPRTGETLVAFVVPAAGAAPDPVELVRHAGRRLARYKLPTRVEFVTELPRTFAGKLVRRSVSG